MESDWLKHKKPLERNFSVLDALTITLVFGCTTTFAAQELSLLSTCDGRYCFGLSGGSVVPADSMNKSIFEFRLLPLRDIFIFLVACKNFVVVVLP